MNKYEINKTFATYEDCKKWEDENIPDRKYKGEPVFMVNHQSAIGEDAVTLTTIVTL